MLKASKVCLRPSFPDLPTSLSLLASFQPYCTGCGMGTARSWLAWAQLAPLRGCRVSRFSTVGCRAAGLPWALGIIRHIGPQPGALPEPRAGPATRAEPGIAGGWEQVAFQLARGMNPGWAPQPKLTREAPLAAGLASPPLGPPQTSLLPQPWEPPCTPTQH